MNIFNLPDLGEGLQEAEIVEWMVKPGDEINVNDPLVTVETAKAIVEIPSPQSGKIFKLFGDAGDMIDVGDPLVEFEGDAASKPATKPDSGTVAGEIQVGGQVVNEAATAVGQSHGSIKATPAVRALAKRLDVDLAVVTPTGPNDTILATDVQRVAKIFEEVGPLQSLRGVRRTMAKTMAAAHAEVVPVTVYDDADIDAWKGSEDVTMRLVRAIVAGCMKEPALNAWYDSHAIGRRVLERIHLGIAVDTEDGLFVPVLRDVGNRDCADLREGLEAIKRDVKNRTIPPEEMRGYTITLSNFGMFGGRYASPIVVPPTVAILGAGGLYRGAVEVNERLVAHWMLPLSLTFDHRSVTGGEATRFIAVVKKELEKKST